MLAWSSFLSFFSFRLLFRDFFEHGTLVVGGLSFEGRGIFDGEAAVSVGTASLVEAASLFFAAFAFKSDFSALPKNYLHKSCVHLCSIEPPTYIRMINGMVV